MILLLLRGEFFSDGLSYGLFPGGVYFGDILPVRFVKDAKRATHAFLAFFPAVPFIFAGPVVTALLATIKFYDLFLQHIGIC